MDAGSLYHSFMRGARHAAGSKPLDPRFTEHASPEIRKAYADGWEAGRKAMSAVSCTATELYGYKPSILRLQTTMTRTGRWQTRKPNSLEGWSDIILRKEKSK